MAKKRKRKYSRGAGRDVKSEMHRYKRGTARSGKGGKGGKVKSRKQAIAIGLSKARRSGVKLSPPRKSRASSQTRKQAQRDLARGKSGRKASPKRSAATRRALKREGRSAASRTALSRQARSAGRKK